MSKTMAIKVGEKLSKGDLVHIDYRKGLVRKVKVQTMPVSKLSFKEKLILLLGGVLPPKPLPAKPVSIKGHVRSKATVDSNDGTGTVAPMRKSQARKAPVDLADEQTHMPTLTMPTLVQP